MVHPFDLTGALPRGTVVLEASAGTGKTFAIAALATRYIAEGATTLDRMLLVTFSRAATQELRSRVRERFELTRRALASAAPPPESDAVSRHLWTPDPAQREARAARLGRALADFDAATIATTHEFCHRMIQALGALAPQDPLPSFVEDLTPEIREAVLDTYLARYADLPSHERPFAPEAALGWMRAVFRQPGIAVGPDDATGTAAERVDFCRSVRDTVERRKHERGISTYDDMLTRLNAALADRQTGPLACRRLAERFPVVLIDEFQDTDPVQWSIVERAFVGSSTVVLIGDPKQAIYGFRGADVYSYLAAVRGQADVATLGTNYRSDAPLVTAVEALLGGAALGEPEIVVRPVHADQPARLHAPAPWDAPLRIRTLPREEEEPLSADEMRAAVDADLVADVGRLLAAGATLDLDGGRPLAPRDVAIIVTTNARGESIQRRLLAAGIPAVFSGTESVFASDGATEWLTLLRAVASPTPAEARQAALTSFVGWQLLDLTNLDERRFLAHLAQLRRWAARFERGGMAALAEAVWHDTDVAARVVARPGGERLLTDLRHVANALQNAARDQSLHLPGLVAWLADQIADSRSAGPQDRMRRLETDAAAVQILTVHRSKGLQFPIVYLPQAGDRYTHEVDDGDCFVLHQPAPTGHWQRMIDVGGRPDERAAREARRSRFARQAVEEAGDDLRRLYVALTRAQCQVTCWWIPTKRNLAASALQRALFRAPEGVPALSYAAQDLTPVLPHLAAAGIQVQAIDPRRPLAAPPNPAQPVPTLRAASFEREVDATWRRTSYSGLTAAVHEAAVVADGEGRESDEPVVEWVEAAAVAVPEPGIAQEPSPLAELPGGTLFGSLVHAVFEHLDTSEDLATTLPAECARWLTRFPVSGVDAPTLANALQPAFHTPLGPVAAGTTLARIAPADRLPELDFELPLGGVGGSATLSDLADVIARHLGPDDPLAAYPDLLRAEGLGEQRLRGFLTGSIDALIRVGDPAAPRFVIVDYKTNRVGAPGAPLLVGNYTRAAMAEAMLEAHYPLQALLYAVATHRFLRWRLPGYEPARHLGGVLYLFVRGMAGPAAVTADGSYGVFDWKPPAALVVELSDRIGGLP